MLAAEHNRMCTEERCSSLTTAWFCEYDERYFPIVLFCQMVKVVQPPSGR